MTTIVKGTPEEERGITVRGWRETLYFRFCDENHLNLSTTFKRDQSHSYVEDRQARLRLLISKRQPVKDSLQSLLTIYS